MNTYLVKIYFYNSDGEKFEIKAESSKKALLTLLETYKDLEDKNIETIKINRLS